MELKQPHKIAVSPMFRKTLPNHVPKNELSLRANLQYEKQLRLHPAHVQVQLDMLVAFIAECFAKAVDDSNRFDYFLSAYYADRILNHFENESVDAIIYPSVRQSLGFNNIAIKPTVFNQFYIPDSAEESIVTVVPKETGGWFMNATGRAREFRDDQIVWQ